MPKKLQKKVKKNEKKFAVLKKAVSLRPQKLSSFSYKFSVFPIRMGESPRGDAASRQENGNFEDNKWKNDKNRLRFDSLYYRKNNWI